MIERRAFLLGRVKGPPGPAPPCRPPEPEHCRDCDAPCLASCEPGIIERLPDNGLPYLSFEQAGCTFCGDCVDACPVETAPALRIGLASLETTACMAWNGTVCTSCRYACDQQAIRVDLRGRPGVDGGTCNGCGACVGVCPTQALTVVP